MVELTREEASLSQTEKPPCCHQTGEIVNQSHGSHADTPQDHDGGKEDGWFEAL